MRQSELIKQLSDRDLIINLYFTQLLLLCIALILGHFLFGSVKDMKTLFQWADLRILYIGGSAGLVVVLTDVLLLKWLPARFFDDGGINERIFTSISTPHLIFLTFVIAVCEEVLFRGVLQTHFGLIIASLIFAFVHIRYISNLFLFTSVIVLSFFIGVIFLITNNLLITIFMHYLIDLLLGLIIKYRLITMAGGDVHE